MDDQVRELEALQEEVFRQLLLSRQAGQAWYFRWLCRCALWHLGRARVIYDQVKELLAHVQEK